MTETSLLLAPKPKKNNSIKKFFTFLFSGTAARALAFSGLMIFLFVGFLFVLNSLGVISISNTTICQADLKNFQAKLADQASVFQQCNSNLDQLSELHNYDRVRMSDAINILLSLQDYNFDKGDLPENLKDLAADNYYRGNTTDPELGSAYYYKRTDSQNYVLCFYLSTGVWGTNKSQCPSKDDYMRK
ncbi:MAG: hypothetical protein MUD10_03925 [Candidatus Pacebacteria bacterium]|nr:hypothetical protein [Candidatus Paceibacterota bacterium]